MPKKFWPPGIIKVFPTIVRDFLSKTPRDRRGVYEKVTGHPYGHSPDLIGMLRLWKNKAFKTKEIKFFLLMDKGITSSLFYRYAGILTGLFLLSYHGASLPIVENYVLSDAYEKREKRHLEYLNSNPEYKRALLEAYDKLRPTNQQIN